MVDYFKVLLMLKVFVRLTTVLGSCKRMSFSSGKYSVKYLETKGHNACSLFLNNLEKNREG